MLNSIVPIAALGGGMWVSAQLIPGQWLLIIALGAAVGFLMPWIGTLLPQAAPSSQAPQQAVNAAGGRGKALYGIAFIIAAMGLWLIWLVLGADSMAALPLGIASTAVFLPGACLGIAAYLITLAWKPVK